MINNQSNLLTKLFQKLWDFLWVFVQFVAHLKNRRGILLFRGTLIENHWLRLVLDWRGIVISFFKFHQRC